MPILYTASVNSVGGRVGHAKSSDGLLDAAVAKPVAMGGDGQGVNPEMLFAAAYGACYGGAVKVVAEKQGATLPDDWSVDAQVSLNQDGANLFLSVKLVLKAPGGDQKKLENVARTAHVVCPYSKAIKGNIETEIMVEV